MSSQEAPEVGATTASVQLRREPGEQAYDAIVVGSGPNGLSAAITLARAGRSVLVLEALEQIGGGLRSLPLTLPGFVHDHCSAIHALAATSPFFRDLPLDQFGLEWLHPRVPLAHVLEDGQAAVADRSLDATCDGLGADGPAYRRLLGPFVEQADALLAQTLGPFRLPSHPGLMTRFGWHGMASAEQLAQRWFRTERARALLAGMAAHSILPLSQRLTAAVGLMLCVTSHHHGWPVARGGSQSIANAMAACLQSLGGEIVIGHPVQELQRLPTARAIFWDLSPGLIARIAAAELPAGYRRRLERFRHGPAAFKLDWALDGPIPWKAAECHGAGTVHVGGTLQEVAEAEQAPWQNRCAERPFLLVAQQSVADSSRAPQGCHTGWAYCHVPPGSRQDVRQRIEDQIERFAPGFRQRILACHVTTPADFQQDNPNLVGGDVSGGVMDAWQLFTRPTMRLCPYSTPNPRHYICSASTPPGPGVHGMCGYYAAQAALRRVLR